MSVEATSTLLTLIVVVRSIWSSGLEVAPLVCPLSYLFLTTPYIIFFCSARCSCQARENRCGYEQGSRRDTGNSETSHRCERWPKHGPQDYASSQRRMACWMYFCMTKARLHASCAHFFFYCSCTVERDSNDTQGWRIGTTSSNVSTPFVPEK